MIEFKEISARISDAIQLPFLIAQATPLSGGSCNQSFKLKGTLERDGQIVAIQYFMKINAATQAAMFSAEHLGLTTLAASHSVRVPKVITSGVAGQHGFIVLEYFDLHPDGNHALLGQQLADLHRIQATHYGWEQDNTLHLTPQHNARSTDWPSFWREQRLGYQLDLAARNGYAGKLQVLGRKIMQALPDLFAGHCPAPSLLHGDLWGGNYAFLADGTPLIFDPAPYFGDREADIAMTELFGGFSAEFYAAYQRAYPLGAAYATRKNLYNLYHILNHCNLFGGSYLAQAEAMMQRLLATVRK